MDVILYINAVGCGHCQNFAKPWESFAKQVKDKFNIQILTTKSVKDSTHDKTMFPQNMDPYLGVYPRVVLFTKNEWERSLKAKDIPAGHVVDRKLINNFKMDDFLKEVETMKKALIERIKMRDEQIKKEAEKAKVMKPNLPTIISPKQEDDVCLNGLNIIGYRCK